MVKLFELGGVPVKCCPLLFAVIPAAVLLGREALLIAAFLSLTVHECAHALAASSLGVEVEAIELQPFGFVARLDCRRARPKELAVIYAAGPLASLVTASASALLEKLVPAYADSQLGLTWYNLLIACVNLLPALPLDGGRLLYAAFRQKSAAAMRILKATGTAVGGAFLAVFALLLARGYLNPTFASMGTFLVIAALREREPLLAPLSRHKRLRPGRSIPVETLAVSQDTRLKNALSLMPKGSYAVINVVGKDLSICGTLDESRLQRAAALLGAEAKLSQAVEISVNGVI